MYITSNDRKPLCIILFVLLCGLSSAAASGRTEIERRSENFLALGTTCSISFDVDKKGRAAGTDQKADPIFNEIKNLVMGVENRMSVNIADSEVSSVNSAAGKKRVKVSDELLKVISEGRRFSALSRGAFDISIGPLVKLWGIGDSDARKPERTEIVSALSLVDYSRVSIRGNEIFLEDYGMRLEPGGIAKGWAADKTAAYLKSQGIESALINLGGNVLAVGSKNDGSAWRIGVQNPDNPRGDYLGILEIRDRAVVSSGKYERYFVEDGIRYHHILSTEDGYPVENGIAQVSIISPSSMTADAMSTSVFSLGLERGLALAETVDDVETIIIMENGDVHISSGIESDFRLTDMRFKIISSAGTGE